MTGINERINSVSYYVQRTKKLDKFRSKTLDAFLLSVEEEHKSSLLGINYELRITGTCEIYSPILARYYEFQNFFVKQTSKGVFQVSLAYEDFMEEPKDVATQTNVQDTSKL